MISRIHLASAPRAHAGGAILLEVLLALVLFVSSASVMLSLLTQAMADMARVRERQSAVDVARTVMGEIEAGIVSPEAAIGVFDPRDRAADAAGSSPSLSASPADSTWWVDIDTQPTEFDSLTLVRVSVSLAQDSLGPPLASATGDESSDPAARPALFTLSQLVRLGFAPSPNSPDDMPGFENLETTDPDLASPGGGGAGGGGAP